MAGRDFASAFLGSTLSRARRLRFEHGRESIYLSVRMFGLWCMSISNGNNLVLPGQIVTFR